MCDLITFEMKINNEKGGDSVCHLCLMRTEENNLLYIYYKRKEKKNHTLKKFLTFQEVFEMKTVAVMYLAKISFGQHMFFYFSLSFRCFSFLSSSYCLLFKVLRSIAICVLDLFHTINKNCSKNTNVDWRRG